MKVLLSNKNDFLLIYYKKIDWGGHTIPPYSDPTEYPCVIVWDDDHPYNYPEIQFVYENDFNPNGN